MLPILPIPVVSGPLRGARFVLGSFPGRGAGIRVYLNREIGNPQREAVLQTVHPGQTVLDLGANVGLFTVLASRCVGPTGRVLAVEPSIRNLAYLEHHRELNRLANVTILSAACADASGLASFSYDLNPGWSRLAANGDKLVPLVTVDQIAERLGSIDAIKIDVEYAELKVLQGARATLMANRPALFLSTHTAELRGRCLDYLRDLSYNCKPLFDSTAIFPVAGEFLCTHRSLNT